MNKNLFSELNLKSINFLIYISVFVTVLLLTSMNFFNSSAIFFINKNVNKYSAEDISIESKYGFVPALEEKLHSDKIFFSKSIITQVAVINIKLTEIANIVFVDENSRFYPKIADLDLYVSQNILDNLNIKIDDNVKIGNKLFNVAKVIDSDTYKIQGMQFLPFAISSISSFDAAGLNVRGVRAKYVYEINLANKNIESFISSIRKEFQDLDIIELSKKKDDDPLVKILNSIVSYLSMALIFMKIISSIILAFLANYYVNNLLTKTAIMKVLGATSTQIVYQLMLPLLSKILLIGIVATTVGYGFYYFGCILINNFYKYNLLLDVVYIFTFETTFLIGISLLATMLFLHAHFKDQNSQKNNLKYMIIYAILIVAIVLCGLKFYTDNNSDITTPILNTINLNIGVINLIVMFIGFVFPWILKVAYISPRVLLNNTSAIMLSLQDRLFVAVTLVGFLLLNSTDHKLTVTVMLYLAALFAISFCIFYALIFIFRKYNQNNFIVNMSLLNMKTFLQPNLIYLLSLILLFTSITSMFLLRSELLKNWNLNQHHNRHNHFVINVLPEYMPQYKNFYLTNNVDISEFYLNLKGKLISINTQSVLENENVRREWNIAAIDQLPQENELIVGDFLPLDNSVSIEQGIASKLKIKLHDKLVFEFGGEKKEFIVDSIRKVNWTNMQPNFFAIIRTQSVTGMHPTYLHSFNLTNQSELKNKLKREFPSINIIDVSVVWQKTLNLLNLVGFIMLYIWLFSTLSSIILIFIILLNNLSYRKYQNKLMKILGADQQIINKIIIFEFSMINFTAMSVSISCSIIFVKIVFAKILNETYVLASNLQFIFILFILATIIFTAITYYSTKERIKSNS